MSSPPTLFAATVPTWCLTMTFYGGGCFELDVTRVLAWLDLDPVVVRNGRLAPLDQPFEHYYLAEEVTHDDVEDAWCSLLYAHRDGELPYLKRNGVTYLGRSEWDAPADYEDNGSVLYAMDAVEWMESAISDTPRMSATLARLVGVNDAGGPTATVGG